MKLNKTETKLIEELKNRVLCNEGNLLLVPRDSTRRFNAAESLYMKSEVRLVKYHGTEFDSVNAYIEIELWSTTVDKICEEVRSEAMKLKASVEADKVFVNPHFDGQSTWQDFINSALLNAKDTEGANVLGSTIQQIKYWSSFRGTLDMILDESTEALVDVKGVLAANDPEAADRVEVQLTFEPRHWNKNAACFIPEAWVAWITEPGGDLQKWPCGKTEEEALEAVKREFNNPRFV